MEHAHQERTERAPAAHHRVVRPPGPAEGRGRGAEGRSWRARCRRTVPQTSPTVPQTFHTAPSQEQQAVPGDVSGAFGALVVRARAGTPLRVHRAAGGTWRSPGRRAGSKARAEGWIRDVPETVPDLERHASAEALILVMLDVPVARERALLGRNAARPRASSLIRCRPPPIASPPPQRRSYRIDTGVCEKGSDLHGGRGMTARMRGREDEVLRKGRGEHGWRRRGARRARSSSSKDHSTQGTGLASSEPPNL